MILEILLALLLGILAGTFTGLARRNFRDLIRFIEMQKEV